jgi:sugar phosphate isomerase/epimerase
MSHNSPGVNLANRQSAVKRKKRLVVLSVKSKAGLADGGEIRKDVYMNRRSFLSSTGLASVAFSATGLSSAAPGPGGAKELHLGTVTYNLARSWDIPTILKNCTETSFEGVELRTTHAHGVEIDLSREKRKEVRKLFADSPVKLVGLGSTCEYHSPDPAVVKKNIEETKAFAKLAADVGAGGVKVRPNGLPPDVAEEKTLEQIGLALRDCGAFAADYGVPIRLEVHGRDTARVPRIRKIMDHANHPNVWVCWNCNNEDLLDDGFEANFKLLQPRLGLVHLRDLYEDYPWRKLVQMLQTMDYQGYSLAEVPESADPIRVMKYIRATFRAFQGAI